LKSHIVSRLTIGILAKRRDLHLEAAERDRERGRQRERQRETDRQRERDSERDR
jgi:hypothetical protein